MRLVPPLRGALAACALMATASPALAQGNGTWALVNARIETVTRGTIERGTIVIRDGLIEAVGANIAPPPDARIVDLANRTVWPGIIDLTSSLGLPTVQAPTGGGPGGGGGGGGGANQQQANQPIGVEPGRAVADELRIQPADLRAARDAGITAVLVAPTRGMFRGRSALVPLRDDSAGSYVVRSPVGLHMGFQGTPGRYPATLLGVVAFERQMFYDAQRHGQLADRYRTNPRGTARPSYDPDLDALVPVVRGQMPVFFAANNENEIRRVARMNKEFGLRTHVVGGTEAFRAVDALRDLRPAVITVDFPEPTQTTGWQYAAASRETLLDSARRDTAARRTLEGNAAALHRAGIRFALASGSLRPADFMGNVRKAIAAGLPREVALQALTIRAAEIAGAEGQLGSIEPGKVAHLVVTERDLLGENPGVRMVFVDGERHEVVAQPAAAANGRRGASAGAAPAAGAEAAAQVAGTWNIVVQSPQGDQPGTLTLTQSGANVDGQMTTSFGTVSIADGRVNGRNLMWSVSLEIQGQRIPISFSAQVDGARMSGRATMPGQGEMTFNGERRP